MIAMPLDLVRVAELRGDPHQQFRPIDGRLAAVQAELVLNIRDRRGVDSQPRGIGPSLGHANQHGHHERAQLIAQRRILDQKTDDSTHGSAP